MHIDTYIYIYVYNSNNNNDNNHGHDKIIGLQILGTTGPLKCQPRHCYKID